MTGGGGGMRGRFYEVVLGPDGDAGVALVERALPGVDVVEGALVGAEVQVSTRAVVVDEDGDGNLRGRPVDPLVARDGNLCFDPSKGGARPRENRRARGAFNEIVTEANRFAIVNAYAHATRGIALFNQLLDELGVRRLPVLRVVVGAHFGSRLPGYACGDGDRRHGQVRPLSGGHYRVSCRTTHVPEPAPVHPDGEVHLGPSRYRKPFAGSGAYLRNAAHNPAIVYHELGHHLCRHTADFRLNGERRPERQRNGKTGAEEGMADYFAAVLLGTGRPYGWYRADRGRRRDPDAVTEPRLWDPSGTAHEAGAAWASAWWRCRSDLLEGGRLTAADHDRALVAALVAVGSVAGVGKRATRRARESLRSSDETMAAAYLGAVAEVGGPRSASSAAFLLERHGLPDLRPAVEASTC